MNLPEPYRTWLRERRFTFDHVRRCQQCETVWFTVELPILRSWKWGRANCCPQHPKVEGATIAQLTPHTSGVAGRRAAYLRARELGAVYRRRECQVPGCIDKTRGREGPSRWTTIEVSADGVVRKDVTECPKCKTWGLLLNGRKRDAVLREQRSR